MSRFAKVVISVILGLNFALFRPDLKIANWVRSSMSIDSASDFVKENSKRIVSLMPPDGFGGGTGFAIKAPSGITYTVTNNHVCEVAVGGKMKAWWDDGRSVLIDVLETNPARDLCILTGLPLIEGFEYGLEEASWADPVFTVGHPYLYPNTYSEGLVRIRHMMRVVMGEGTEAECKKKGLKFKQGLFEDVCYGEFDAFDTSIVGYPGNSGSPVFNKQGKVVGVIFAGNGAMNTLSYVPLEYLHDLIRPY